MIRIAALADNQRDPNSRVEEHDRVMDFIADECERRDVHLVLHAGDWTERRSTHEDRDYLFHWVQRIAADRPLVTCEGNHEEPEFCQELALVHTINPVHVATTPRMVHGQKASTAMLPWARRGALLAWAKAHGLETTREDLNQRTSEFMRDVLRGFATQWPEGIPRILMAHMIPTGYVTGPDQPPMVGCDFELSVEDLALADADVVVLGHGHRPCEWEFTAADGRVVPVIMCGSPRRTAYSKGEQEPKGFVVLEFDGRRLVGWERVPTPATPMVLVEARWDAERGSLVFEAGAHWYADTLRGAEARLRYTVDADHRDAARAYTAALVTEALEKWGALEVKLEEQVRPTVRARAPQIAEAVGLDAKLRSMWTVTDPEMGDDRRERLLAKVGEVQEGI